MTVYLSQNCDVAVHNFFFFFNDTATTEIYSLSLHDALPIWPRRISGATRSQRWIWTSARHRSEEHTSELQSRLHLVCRLLLEKKNHKLRPMSPLARHWSQNVLMSVRS